MAIEKTVNINVDTENATKNVDKLSLSFEELKNAATVKEFNELKKRLKEMALAGEKGSREFIELAAKAGELQGKLSSANKEVKQLSQSFNSALVGSLQGVAHGFEFASGLMGAFGVDSEKMEEALLQVQSAMAMAQGIQGLIHAFKSFKALMIIMRAAAAANPLGAIITAISILTTLTVALILKWDEFTKWIGIVDDESEKLANENLKRTEDFLEQSRKRIEALEKERKAIEKTRDFEIRMMRARGDSEADIFYAIQKNRKERLKANIEFKNQISAEQKMLEEQWNLLYDLGELTEKKGEEINKQIEINNDKILKLEEESVELARQMQIDEVEFTRQAELDKLKAQQEAADKRKARREKEAAERKAREEKELAEKLARIAKEAQAESDLITEIAKLEDEYLQSKIEKEQQEINAVYDKYFALIEAAKQHGEDTALLEEAQQAAIKEIKDRYRKEERLKQAELYKKSLLDAAQRVKEEEEREIALKDAKLSIASETFGALGDLVKAFAGENEEQQRRAFNIQKAISIAQAVIDTYKGANAIFASAAANPGTVLFPAQPFIAAGAAIASGLANVATIARQEFNPSGGGASTGAGGGGGASNPPAALSTPAVFNVVGNTGTNQLAETLGQQPLQAYVVAGDVTTAQSLERNKIQQSTL